MSAVLGLAAWFDLRTDKIPNRLILWGMISGGLIRILYDVFVKKTPQDIMILIFEVTFLFFCLWPIYQMGGLGAGDSKLLLMTGVFLPVKQALFMIATAFFLAAAAGILKLLADGTHTGKRKIHFTPPLLASAVLYTGIFLLRGL